MIPIPLRLIANALLIVLANANITNGEDHKPKSQTLRLASPLKGGVTTEEPTVFAVDVTSASLVVLDTRSLGSTYSLTIKSPSGSVVAALTNDQEFGYESLAFVAPNKGRYLAQFNSTSERLGGYELTLSTVRPRDGNSPRLVLAFDKLRSADKHFSLGKNGSLADLETALDLYKHAAEEFELLNYDEGHAKALSGAGQVLAFQGYSEQSLTFYRLALKLVECVPDARNLPLWFATGDALISTADYESAKTYLEKVKTVSRTSGDRHLLAESLEDLALIVSQKGQPQESLAVNEEALLEAEKAHDALVAAEIRVNMGLAIEATGEYAKALPYFQQSLVQERKLPNRGDEASTLHNIGVVHTFLGNLALANREFTDSLELYRRIGNVDGEAQELVSLGDTESAQGHYENSITLYTQARERAEECGDRSLQSHSLASLGYALFQTADYPRSITSLQESLNMYLRIDDKSGAANSMLVLGLVNAVLGNNTDALKFYDEALKSSREIEDRSLEAEILASKGLLQQTEGDSLAARGTLEHALKIDLELKDRYGQAYVLTSLGMLYSKGGDTEKSREALEQALKLAQDLDNPVREAIIRNAAGLLELKNGEYDAAIRQFEEALIINREHQTKAAEGITLGNLMLAWKAKDSLPAAALFGIEAVNIFQKIRVSISTMDKRVRTSFISSKEQTYRTLADILIAQGRLLDAEKVLNMLKVEEFNNYVRGGDLSDKIDATLEVNGEEALVEQRYQEIADRVVMIATERSALLAKKRNKDEEARLFEVEKSLANANAHFNYFLDHVSTEFNEAGKNSERITTIKEAQGLMEDLKDLGPGTVAAYTLLGEEKFRVILIAPDIQIAREFSIGRTELMRKILDFRLALQNPDSDAKKQGQEVYEVIVGPIEKDLRNLRAQTVMWSLDGALRYLPVAALYDGKQYFIEQYSSVIFTPASVPRLKDKPSPLWSGAGFGVTRAIGGFAALPAAEGELVNIFHSAGRASGVIDGDIFLDERFTEATLRTSLRSRRPVVHIASHFAFNPGNDSTSFLLLGDGNRLTLAAVKNSTLLFDGVDMLTLSSCNTALNSKTADGREVEGLAVLAQRQGAKAVIATLWSVNDDSTGMLMRDFYRLKVNNPTFTKLDALRTAQLDMLHSKQFAGGTQSPNSNPYFWAPFILTGNWK